MRHVRVLVLGGGITGLAAAERVAATLGDDAVLLLEAGARLGGKIITVALDGAVIEGGPDCFLAVKPAALELCRRLGIEDRLIGTDPGFRRSYIKRGGELLELPDGLSGLVPSRLGPLARTRVLSPLGRMRAALELFVPRSTDTRDESIAGFVTRRFGREAYDWLIEPLLGGIHAGDGERLSLTATFPQLAEVERTHGGVLRAMMKAKLRPRPAPNGRPTGFLTLKGGLGELVGALERQLAGRALTAHRVRALRQVAGGWQAVLAGGETISADSVIVATPADAAAPLVMSVAPALAAELGAMRFASTVTVTVAFPAAAVPRPLPGYGYVAPRAGGGSVIACSWTSHKFPARVPRGTTLLRLFLGRDGDDAVASAGDDEIRRIVREELRAVHGITAEPALWRVFRWPDAMPQYTLGHQDRLARIAAHLEQLPGLLLAGSSYRGAGIPDCIASGWAAADAALVRAHRADGDAPVRVAVGSA